MREFGHEQKGLMRHRKERGDTNRLRTSGNVGLCGGHTLSAGPAPTEIRNSKSGKVYVRWPGEYGETKYRKAAGHWERWEAPITPWHGSPHWMTISEWAVPQEIKQLSLD